MDTSHTKGENPTETSFKLDCLLHILIPESVALRSTSW